MRVRKLVAGWAALLALLAQVAVVGVGPIEASTEASLTAVTPLPSGFGAIAVEGAGQRVFVSSPAASAVTVLTAGGAVETTLSVPGADALLVDGTRLYVASTTGGRIDVFDTGSLALVASYGGGSLVAPRALVMAGGKLWTTTGNCNSFTVRLVSISTSSGAVTTHPTLTDLSYCPFLFGSPVDQGVLFGFEEGLSPTTLVRLGIGPGGPAVEGTLRTTNGNARDAEVLPDGQTLALASGAPYEIRTFRTDPLAEHGVRYPTGNYPNAVEVTAANGGLLAAARDAVYENDLDVFRLGDPSTPLFRHDFGVTSNTVKTDGLAFSPDGTRLYAVSGDWSGDTAQLNVFNLADPNATDTGLVVTPTYAAQGDPVTLTATVTARGGGAPTGLVGFYEGASLRGSAALDGLGRATLVLSSLPVGAHTFTARYEGDGTFRRSSGEGAAVVHGPGTANPLAVVPLPRTFGAIEADPATGRVFVSSPGSGVVTVLNETGTVLGSVPVPGAGALLVDGPTLYVVSTTGGRIDAFNTTTLAPAGSYGGGALLLQPSTLVKAGGQLWTAAGSCGDEVRLVSINPATGQVTAHDPIFWLDYCPLLFTSPTDPNLVLGFDKGLSPTTVVRIDVASGSPVVETTLRTENANGKDGEVLPDGQTFALATGSPYEIRTFLVDPLQQFGVVYPTGHYPNAVEVTGAGGGLLAAGRDSSSDVDIDVFRIGDPSAPLFRHDFGSSNETIVDRGLAFGSEGRTLFAVSGSWSDTTVRLHVLDLTDPATVRTSLSLSSSANPSAWGQATTLTARLTTFDGTPVPGEAVQFRDGATSLGTATSGPDGRASLTTSSLEVGTHDLSATYAGSATLEPASAPTLSQLVQKAATSTAVSSSANPVGQRQPVTFTATVSRAVAGTGPITGSVTFRSGSATLGTATLQNGRATLTVTLNQGTHSIAAAYGGDTHFLPSTSPAFSQVVSKKK